MKLTCSSRGLLILFALMLASGALAHGTLFGTAPRTMWPDGNEVEFDTHFEQFYRFMEEDSQVANVNDVRVTKVSSQVAWTHGFSNEWAARLEIPFAYAKREDRFSKDSFAGIEDISIAVSWRLDPLIWGQPYTFKGGSFRIGAFGRVRLPTAEKRGVNLLSPKLGFGDETFGLQLGLLSALSTTKYYAWSEISANASTTNNGTGKGPGAKVHFAFARRVLELRDYRELDLIALVELDAEVRGKGQLNGVVNPNSGYFKTHLALGAQVNITNVWEIKAGYNIPIYRRFGGRQFVHDGILAFSVNYLF